MNEIAEKINNEAKLNKLINLNQDHDSCFIDSLSRDGSPKSFT